MAEGKDGFNIWIKTASDSKAQNEVNFQMMEKLRELSAAYKQANPVKPIQNRMNKSMDSIALKQLKEAGKPKGIMATIKQNNPMKSLAGKLLAGGLLIGALKMLVGASPMLKQMMKMMGFAVNLILRPIGDFIGFALRPIMLMLLRNFILPFYRNVMPQMIKMGTWLGETLAPIIKNVITGLAAVGKILFGAFTFNLGLVREGVSELGVLVGMTTAATEKGTHEIINVKNAVDANGNVVSASVSKVISRMSAELALLKSSPGKKGARPQDANMMEDFAAMSGADGFKKSRRLLSGMTDSNALMTIGAGQTNIQARISSGSFESVDDAMAAYFRYIISARREGKSGGGTDSPQMVNSNNKTYVFQSEVNDPDAVVKKIEDTDLWIRHTRYNP